MATIGLLMCGHVHPDAVPIGGDYPVLFADLLGPVGLTVRAYDVDQGRLPASLDECDGWVTSPSASSAYDDEPWIGDALEIVRRLVHEERLFFGICFGHQLMAQALGGRVERAAVGWGVGAKEYEVVASRPWMAPPAVDGRFTLIASHQDQVTVLPAGATLLATSDYCPNVMMEIGERAVGLQPHPEFTAPISAALTALRADRIGADIVAAATASLGRPLDRDLVAHWLATFFATP